MRLQSLLAMGALIASVVSSSTGAQRLAPPPIRPLGRVVARSHDVVGPFIQIRALPGGRLLVSDLQLHRVLLMDSSLATVSVVFADTTGGVKKGYGANGGGLLAYFGDTSLYADFASSEMLVVTATGTVKRSIEPPKGDLGGLGYTYMTDYNAAFDGVGHIISEWPQTLPPSGGRGAAQGQLVIPAPRDSAPLVRVDIATKRADTVTWLAVTGRIIGMVPNPSGFGPGMMSNPMAFTDDWTVLPDGTVAAVRGSPYHIDWIARDGTRTSSPEIPHDWGRLSDSAKHAFVDSITTLNQAATQVGAGAGRGAGGGGMLNGATGAAPAVSSLPDTRPPFIGLDNVRADASGNIWIRVNQAVPGAGEVFDVVNRQGRLIDRVRTPAYMTVVAFAPGVVILTSHEGTVLRLQRMRIR